MNEQIDDARHGEQEPDSSGSPDSGEQHRQVSGDDVQLSEDGREEVREMVEAYEDKPTVVLPGSHGTISGTAINEWLDDEGNPKFGDPDEHPDHDNVADSDNETGPEPGGNT